MIECISIFGIYVSGLLVGQGMQTSVDNTRLTYFLVAAVIGFAGSVTLFGIINSCGA